MGFGQEDVWLKMWQDGDRLREGFANPEHLIRYGARDLYDPETGYKLPEKVVVFGSFQPWVGAVENDSNSEITRMYHVEKDLYTLSIVLPDAGVYDYAVSTYGTLSAVYTQDSPRPVSGSGHKVRFVTPADNCVVRFTFRFMEGVVKCEITE